MSVYLAIFGILSGVTFELVLITAEADVLHESIQFRQGQVIFDRVDPRTGVSDCLSKAAFCVHPLYRQVMREQCPSTCQRIGLQYPDGVVNPTVQVPSNRVPVDIGVNPLPVNPMHVKPAVQVGNDISTYPMPMPPVAHSHCVDHVSPKTGVPDCIGKKPLCKDPLYQQLMWEQCPQTCGKCPGVPPNSAVIPVHPVNPVPAIPSSVTNLPVVQGPVAKPPPVKPAPAVSLIPVKPAPSTGSVPVNPSPVIHVPVNPTLATPASLALVALKPPPVVNSNCCDNVDPKTGKSECARMVQFCRHPTYTQVMREQCRKTCGFC